MEGIIGLPRKIPLEKKKQGHYSFKEQVILKMCKLGAEFSKETVNGVREQLWYYQVYLLTEK